MAGASTYGIVTLVSRKDHRPPDSAPPRTAVGLNRFGGYVVSGRTVTINKPRQKIYDFWRDFKNLTFMENIKAVDVLDDERVRWTIAGPAGVDVSVETKLAQDRPGELIAWRSIEGSDIDTEGRIAFRDAPAGRGTYVEAIVAYKPPGGDLGRLVAKLFQREPHVQGRRELKRLKVLMETGEFANSANRRNT